LFLVTRARGSGGVRKKIIDAPLVSLERLDLGGMPYL